MNDTLDANDTFDRSDSRATPGATAATETCDKTRTGNPARREPGDDRRRYTLRTLCGSVVSARRTAVRRQDDRRYPMLDRFDSGMLALAVTLVGLSIVDATFTLMLLAAGGSEVNPFMNWMLGHGVGPFTIVKLVLTAVPAVLLVATGNLKVFGIVRARSVLAAFVGMYAGLIVYEIGLLAQITY